MPNRLLRINNRGLLNRLHERRIRLNPILLPHLALHRLHDWLSPRRQHAPDVHILGNGRLMQLRADLVLVQETGIYPCRCQSFHNDPHRRHRATRSDRFAVLNV